ncbi:MAG TPA: class I fructose-bisphosphate aldolase [Steroidobacteraceae bacterium]|nr:class I fructose-bisphosphate aldolase [Steroidobacteraceae bacterium]
MPGMNTAELAATAHAMVSKNRGLLAADESTSTILRRFNTIKLDSTEETRRSYREMLFTTPGASEYISGVILFDETIRQKTKDGVPFPAYLSQHNMIPGIKVDTGAKPLAGFPGETITEGLDGLRERLAEYYKLGARFAKWRAVIDIGAGIPTGYAIDANAEGLARYAALCQEAGIVPIVEPEVLMDGDHPIERCEEVTNAVLQTVFDHLFAARIVLEGMVLKPNMVIAGKKSAKKASPEQVAEATVRTLKRHVPSAVPGIAFLSGGQSPSEATLHLSLMNAGGPLPWPLTFSYGRALQDTSLRAWGGAAKGVAGGQQQLHLRAKLNGLAAAGKYQPAMESSAA